ncbi:MAG: hypothetical protein IAE91_08220 [Ignavibacteriaceae bacterium]|nr:hypothetical protein [Ignavibacteriaceae bacterium]
MATKIKPAVRKTGKKPDKKPLIDPRYKSLVNTVIFLVVALIFFIVNNTRYEPESGPLPPLYKSKVEQKVQNDSIDSVKVNQQVNN